MDREKILQKLTIIERKLSDVTILETRNRNIFIDIEREPYYLKIIRWFSNMIGILFLLLHFFVCVIVDVKQPILIFTFLVFVVLPFIISYYTKVKYKKLKQKKYETFKNEIESNNSKISILHTELDDETILPSLYLNNIDLPIVKSYIDNLRADTIKEAINLYELEQKQEEKYRALQSIVEQQDYIIKSQSELLKEHRKSSELLRKIKNKMD